MIDYSQGSGKQYHIHLAKEDVGSYVLLSGDPGRCELIASFLKDAKKLASNREYVSYSGTLENEKVVVMSTGMGGPAAAIALEELVACGANTFIRIGTCGGMDLDVKGGDLVIATSAVRSEGTSKEYAPVEYPAVASFEIVNSLKQASDELKQTSHVGVVHSKDSFYAQHRPETLPNCDELISKWKAWNMLGCKASEMECAALFIVSSYLKVRTGACLLCLANQEREKLGMENIQNHEIERAIKVSIEALRKLILQDRQK